MNDDLISRKALINAKPEFMNEKIVRDTKYQTSKVRIYAKAWNACNSYWLDTIKIAPVVETTIENLISTLSVEELKATTRFKVDTPSGEAISFRREKTGHWIDHSEDEGYVECPFCHELTNCNGNKEELHYCWHCGAKMTGGAE
jgi:hypothetical protein